MEFNLVDKVDYYELLFRCFFFIILKGYNFSLIGWIEDEECIVSEKVVDGVMYVRLFF